MTKTLLAGCTALALAGALAAPSVQAAPPKRAAAAPVALHGVDVAGMDPSVVPGDDFARYGNGGWMKATEIPADRSSWGVFAILREKADKRTADLIKGLAAGKAAPGSNAQKIGDYYGAFMDEAAIEKAGVAPLKPTLDAIAAVHDRQGLAQALGAEMRQDVDPLNNTNFHTAHLFGLWTAPDFDHPGTNAAYMLQGGVSLPDRDYYLSDSPRMAEIRGKYLDHVAAVFRLAGYDQPEARAKRVMDLETAIAKAHWSAVESRDVTKADNRWTRADFKAKAPGLDWDAFFAAAGLNTPTVIVWQPSAFAGLSRLVADAPLESWKDLMAFHAIDEAATYLPKAFVDENFAFNIQTLTGAPQQQERWKRAVTAVNAALGEAVGQKYVRRYFPASAKAEAQAMATNIKAAFVRRIDALDWMDPKTKAEAKKKVASLIVGVGYPDHWRNYSGLTVVKGEALGNWRRSTLFDYRQAVAKIGRPVDRGEWSMTPQTVNAVNLPLQNALNFPAAILEAPFFDPHATTAVNYGAIGSVIGHEISHAFDNQGAEFDSTGRLRNWWTKADFAHFQDSSTQLVKQFDAYAPFPDLHVNGELTIGENIADLAGLAAAYDAWKASLGGKPAPVKDGFSGDQQFFIANSQAHRAKAREAALRKQIQTNEHAPDEYRADNVRNQDAWYAAFKVQPGQKLYLEPKDRVRVW